MFAQDDPAEHFYFVHCGQIRLFRLSAEGEEKIIELIGPGQTFAEALLFMGTAAVRRVLLDLCNAEGWRIPLTHLGVYSL